MARPNQVFTTLEDTDFQFLENVCTNEDRPMSYVVRSFLKKGMAADPVFTASNTNLGLKLSDKLVEEIKVYAGRTTRTYEDAVVSLIEFAIKEKTRLRKAGGKKE